MEEFSTTFEATLSDPLSYLQPSEKLKTSCVNGVKKLFDFYKNWSANTSLNVPTGPLSELYIDDFDNEQIWAEIELMNEPVLKNLKKHLKRVSTRVTEQPVKTLSILKNSSSKLESTEVEESDLDDMGSEDDMDEEEGDG